MSSNVEALEPYLGNDEQLVEHLQQLSGRYLLDSTCDAFPVSNDRHCSEVVSEVSKLFWDGAPDVGVFIGGGGMASWMAELRPSTAVMIDLHPEVLEYNAFLLRLIGESSSPADVLARLDQLQGDEPETKAMSGWLGSRIAQEAAEYGAYHWSDEQRFQAARQAVLSTPTAYINADLADPEFHTAFSDVLRLHGRRVSFANLTNVMIHIRREPDFAKNWPYDNKHVIVSSSLHGRLLGMGASGSYDEYEARGRARYQRRSAW